MNNKVKPGYKWAVSVIFAPSDSKTFKMRKGVDEVTEAMRKKYNAFKQRMIQSIPSCKETNFCDKNMSLYKILGKPSDVFDYFYALNPIPGDDILNGARVKIERVWFSGNAKLRKNSVYGESTKETASIVEGGEDNGIHK